MSKEFAPMLAATAPADLNELPWEKHGGYLASPKLDGIRALVRNGMLLSRNMKPIPNPSVQGLFGRTSFNGLDGELIVGDPGAKDCFRRTTSACMTHSVGKNDNGAKVYFWVFDTFSNSDRTYAWRAASAARYAGRSEYVIPLVGRHVSNVTELLAYEQEVLNLGYEGVMLRAAGEGQHGLHGYKNGRSTVSEGYLIKLKRFEDAEARVIGVEEEMRNDNTRERDALGRSKRSTAQAGLVGKGTLGALQVRNLSDGVAFSIGSGFTGAERAKLWVERTSLPGRVVKYKYFPSGGKEAPRFPVFLGWREDA